MKNLGIKLFSVLVILLFCLSPLGAIDLGQGDNATYANDNNGTDIKDVNDTIENNHTVKVNDSDIEIKKLNETADLNEEGNEIESQGMSSNDSDSSQNLKMAELGLHVSVDDTSLGQSPVMKIWTDDSRLIDSPIYISILGPNYYEEYEVDISKGTNEFKLSDDLSPGTYLVTADFPGYPAGRGGYWDPETATDYFTVNKLKPNLEAHIDNINPEDNPVVKFTCSDDLVNNIKISSPYLSKDYVVHASKGSFECKLDENFTPGNYYCTISYSGDDTHDSTKFRAYFDVDKYDPNLKISIADIHEGEYPVVKIKTNESYNGNVFVYFRDDDGLYHGARDVKVVDGVGELTFPKTFKPGEHSATAIFYANGRFRYSEKSTKFMVN